LGAIFTIFTPCVYGQQLAAMAAIYWLFVIGGVVFESVDVSLTLAWCGKTQPWWWFEFKEPPSSFPYYQLLY
jgi:hypothetical protein